MKTTLDIPDDLAREVRRRAERDGRELDEQFIWLLRLGLGAADVPVPDFEGSNAAADALATEPDTGVRLSSDAPASLRRDPVTGLLVIDSPPDAPILSLGLDEVLRLTQDALAEDDLKRAGLPVRH